VPSSAPDTPGESAAPPPAPNLALAALKGHEREREPDARDRYERLENLGSGGMAVVYRALDRKLGREVAIKELRADLALEPEAVARFRREADAVARLSHPNVVLLLDAVETGGRLLLVMELVRGEPLSQLLPRRRASQRELVHLLEKAARGVQHAHERGIVHRDLKPSNILVDAASGEPKVADFGIAHLGGADRTTLTRTGAFLGTPLYMAPEQVQGRTALVSARTDVYALGVILYELLTGRVPFPGETVPEIGSRIVNEEPIAPRKLNPQASRDLETIALHAMEKDPARRYASASELADDLARTLAGEPIHARPPGPLARLARLVRRRKAPAAALAAFLAAALLGGGLAGLTAFRAHETIARLLAEAAREPDPRRAAELYSQVTALAPGHPIAEAGAIEKRIEADRRSRAAAAGALVARGEAAREEVTRLTAAIERARDAIAPLASGLATYAPPEKKRPIWELEQRIEDLTREVAVAQADYEAAYLGALAIDPTLPGARDGFAALHYASFEEAETRGDVARMELERRLVLIHGGPSYRERLAAGGAIALDARPGDAEAWLFRYEPGTDRRLMPRPYDRASATTRLPEAESNAETSTALSASDWNRLGRTPLAFELPVGSYLVLLRKPGFRDVRFPLFVTRGGRVQATVALYRDAEIGADYVYVPAGEFIFGGDPAAYLGNTLDVHATTGDFFIARFEVTFASYQAFVKALAARDGTEAAQKRVPRRGKTAYLWTLADDGVDLPSWAAPDVPVVGITADDANAYAAWLTAAAHERGERVRYRLPLDREWEKAARGVDGRFFPWGNHFDWTFTKGALSRKVVNGVGAPPDPVGTFRADESPYGVRDLAGSVEEWCDGDWLDNVKIVRGGHYAAADPGSFRSATRTGAAAPELRRGFRLVRELER
jgi:formylglycine-generating enzyme required for sulfatase activity